MLNIKRNLRWYLLKECNDLSEQEIGFLFETETGKIKSFDVNGLDYGDVLLEGFGLFYELEYKYHKILNNQFSGNEKRRENIIKIISIKVEQLVERLGETLEHTYEEWVGLHDYENPSELAKNRLDVFNRDNMIKGIINDYIMFTEGHSTHDPHKKRGVLTTIVNIINYSPDKFPITKEYLSDNSSQNELIYDLDILNNLSENCYYEIYGNIITPILLDTYPSLKENVDNNKKILKNLENITSLSLSKQFVMINKALNGVHTSGSMASYYIDRYDINEKDLNNLSNINVSNWDKELKMLGFKL